MTALMTIGGAVVANDACKNMNLEKAVELHRDGGTDDPNYSCAVTQVQNDIKACLQFYGLSDCKGPAKVWVDGWNNLQLPELSSDDDAFKSVTLPKPSFFGLHAPFSPSTADYLAEIGHF